MKKDHYINSWLNEYNDQMKIRVEKREEMLKKNINPYKNGFAPNILSSEIHALYNHLNKEEIEVAAKGKVYKLAGRVLLVRSFGKAAFLSFDDGSEKFQLYVKREELDAASIAEYDFVDYGDVVYAEGEAFKTNKGELSLKVHKFVLLTKSIRPLPEKFHGLSDPELRYRMRYVDLIMNPKGRDTFIKRANIIRYIRDFFYKRQYLEVETPMLHSVAGGATAKPFLTHHNALDMPMYMRVAPELHLKRLIVSGYPRVFELNRCFRNEGLSLKHNPEFTSIEFYQAYATYVDLMDLTEDLINGLAKDVMKTEEIVFDDKKISLAKPFKRMSMKESIVQYTSLKMEDLDDREKLISLLKTKGHAISDLQKHSTIDLMVLCFDEFVEKNLIQPTFITEYPTAISPLSRRNDQNPEIVDRFELFINSWEVANAFSELNNPLDQLLRFAEQAVKKDQGDDEAQSMDYDYVRALEYGMAPTAGEGIGIDRLCMILTNNHSIRDVLLFPQLKNEQFFSQETPDTPETQETPEE
ncbi:MAG: lysine--tRNA ligase [Oligoflexia bacterium]|nr:lysine--tRNA ligase [Oligoflexia bacterium]